MVEKYIYFKNSLANNSLPLEGGGLRWGCICILLPTPSPSSPPLKGGEISYTL
jgi:hypothetical protein